MEPSEFKMMESIKNASKPKATSEVSSDNNPASTKVSLELKIKTTS